MRVRLEVCDAKARPASELIEAVLAEYDVVAGRALRGGPSATPADFSPPGGVYVVGFVGDAAVCGAGVKHFAAGVAEIKRLYVVPGFRGRGLAAAALEELERIARDLGYRAVRIDCQRANWPVYRAAGFQEVVDYNANPHAEIWGEKQL